MKKKKRILLSNKASASSESSTLCTPVEASPCKSNQEADHSENDLNHLNSPQDPQPGTSTGGVTPSGPQLNISTRGSVRSAAKGRVYKEYGSDSSDQSSSSDSESGDDEWRPGPDTDSVPQTARKTNNPSG